MNAVVLLLLGALITLCFLVVDALATQAIRVESSGSAHIALGLWCLCRLWCLCGLDFPAALLGSSLLVLGFCALLAVRSVVSPPLALWILCQIHDTAMDRTQIAVFLLRTSGCSHWGRRWSRSCSGCGRWWSRSCSGGRRWCWGFGGRSRSGGWSRCGGGCCLVTAFAHALLGLPRSRITPKESTGAGE